MGDTQLSCCYGSTSLAAVNASLKPWGPPGALAIASYFLRSHENRPDSRYRL